jgi:hypothetical protein
MALVALFHVVYIYLFATRPFYLTQRLPKATNRQVVIEP